MHVFVIGLLFILIGAFAEKASRYLYVALGLMALCIPILMPIPGLDITYWSTIKAVHWLVFLPAILYFSVLGFKNAQNKKTFSQDTYHLVLYLGIFIVLYHSYKLYIRVSRSSKVIHEDHTH